MLFIIQFSGIHCGEKHGLFVELKLWYTQKFFKELNIRYF